MTNEVPNFHTDRLVYKHFELDDHHSVDIAQHFEEAEQWLEQVMTEPKSRVLG